jgi:hypothetical protein
MANNMRPVLPLLHRISDPSRIVDKIPADVWRQIFGQVQANPVRRGTHAGALFALLSVSKTFHVSHRSLLSWCC